MDQKTVLHLHNEILCKRKKEGAPILCDSMAGTGGHYAKWNKPGLELNQQNQISEQNRTRGMEIRNKLTITRGAGGGE